MKIVKSGLYTIDINATIKMRKDGIEADKLLSAGEQIKVSVQYNPNIPGYLISYLETFDGYIAMFKGDILADEGYAVKFK